MVTSHYVPKKDIQNKSSNLRSQSVAKQIQKRELAAYEESLLQQSRLPLTSKAAKAKAKSIFSQGRRSVHPEMLPSIAKSITQRGSEREL